MQGASDKAQDWKALPSCALRLVTCASHTEPRTASGVCPAFLFLRPVRPRERHRGLLHVQSLGREGELHAEATTTSVRFNLVARRSEEIDAETRARAEALIG